MNSTIAPLTGAWQRVTRAHPCPICGRSSWCQVSPDGATVQCMRVPSDRHRIDTTGCDFWLHRLGGAAAPPREFSPPLEQPPRPRAPVETLSAVYGALLAALPLSSAHRENLRGRGLPDAEIDRRGYRSLPGPGRAALARRLVERFGAETCAGVPGLYRREEEGRAWWSVAGRSGLLIPVRDVAARIIALRVRADVSPDDDENRYSSVSSTRHGGPGPGAPPHVPLYTGSTETVRLTEGELKSDVATVLGDMLCIGVPGAPLYCTALPVLRQLGTRTIRLAYDADWRTNEMVRCALAGAARCLAAEGFTVVIETWEG